MPDSIRDYIDRAKQAQQEHDERPGTQIALPLNELCPVCFQPDNCGDCDHTALSDNDWRVLANPNHDCDPGDCTDYRGE